MPTFRAQLDKFNLQEMLTFPFYIKLLFFLTTFELLRVFFVALSKSTDEGIQKRAVRITAATGLWLVFQGVMASQRVYSTNLQTLPPKIALFGVLPALLFIIALFFTARGRAFIDSLPLKYLIWLHIIRIPVEMGLYFLALEKMVPELMTFGGRNFDILAGLTAPFVAYYGVVKGQLNRRIILIWNIVCLCLLANIVTIAVLSIPTPIQQFGFHQPNLAVLNFPVSWLPTFIVPMVLFCHLAAIRQLWKR